MSICHLSTALRYLNGRHRHWKVIRMNQMIKWVLSSFHAFMVCSPFYRGFKTMTTVSIFFSLSYTFMFFALFGVFFCFSCTFVLGDPLHLCTVDIYHFICIWKVLNILRCSGWKFIPSFHYSTMYANDMLPKYFHWVSGSYAHLNFHCIWTRADWCFALFDMFIIFILLLYRGSFLSHFLEWNVVVFFFCFFTLLQANAWCGTHAYKTNVSFPFSCLLSLYVRILLYGRFFFFLHSFSLDLFILVDSYNKNEPYTTIHNISAVTCLNCCALFYLIESNKSWW